MSKLTSYNVTFHLEGLPTPQHKAGLGGLVFLLDYIAGRDDIPEDEKAEHKVEKDCLKLTLTPASIQRLFDELYSSVSVTQTTKTKPKGDHTEHEVSLPDGKTEKVFKYQDDRPKGPWLYERLKTQAEEAIAAGMDPWHKLWQDSLWQTFRGIPATRNVFTGSKDKLVKEFWTAFEKKTEGKPVALEIASTIYVGAQSKNPEGIGFDGSPDEVFLLHFAQVLAQPYKVVGVDSQGKTTWPGVIWVFPEPSNLRLFAGDCKKFLQHKAADDPFFRSRSRVTLPQEAALCLMADDAIHLALKDTGEMGFKGALCTQLKKEGNNINLLSASYVPRNHKLINGYKEIVAGVKSHPLRHLLLTNLLKGQPLYKGAAKLLSYLPAEAALPQGMLGHTISRDSKYLLEDLMKVERTAV